MLAFTIGILIASWAALITFRNAENRRKRKELMKRNNYYDKVSYSFLDKNPNSKAQDPTPNHSPLQHDAISNETPQT